MSSGHFIVLKCQFLKKLKWARIALFVVEWSLKIVAHHNLKSFVRPFDTVENAFG